MKSVNYLFLLIFSSLLMSCEIQENNPAVSEDDSDNFLKKKETKVSSSSRNEIKATVVIPCDCKSNNSQSNACELECSGIDLRYLMATVIRDRPCDFPTGCFDQYPMDFDMFDIAINSYYPEYNSASIVTSKGELFASSLKEFGGSIDYDEKNGLNYINFGIVNDDLRSEFLLLEINTAIKNEFGFQKIEGKLEIGLQPFN